MKNKIITFLTSLLLTVGVLGVTTLNTGCVSFKKFTTDNPATFDQAVVLLKGGVQAACQLAISKDKNSKDWLFLVATSIDSVIQGQDYTPGALTKAISSVPVDELKSDIANLVVISVTTTYEMYFAKYGKNFFSTKEPEAKKLLEAVSAGIHAALK